MFESGHEDLAKVVKDNTNNMLETSKINKPFLCKLSSDENNTSETKHTVMSLAQEHKSMNGISDKKSRTSLPDRIPSPTSVCCNDQLHVQASQLEHWFDLLDNTNYVKAFEPPGNNVIGYSSAGLKQTNIYKNETVPPEIPKHSSSNNYNTGAVMSPTHEIKSITRLSKYEIRPSPPDRPSSPVSVSSDDQSCVQSSLLDRGFDLHVTDSTIDFDTFECLYLRTPILTDQIPSPSPTSSDKSASKTPDNQSKSALPDKTSSPSSTSSDKSASNYRSRHPAEEIVYKDIDRRILSFSEVKPGDCIGYKYWALTHNAIVVDVIPEHAKRNNKGILAVCHFALDSLFGSRHIKIERFHFNLLKDTVVLK